VAVRFSTLIALAVLFAHAGAAEPDTDRVAAEIREEAIRSNRDAVGRPLPLAAHWNVSGVGGAGFSPAYQVELLKKGHHILPWLDWPPTDQMLNTTFKKGDTRRQQYIDKRMKEYEPIIKELARRRLPISFLATQWESILTYDKAFLDLPAEKNPNSIGTDGKVQHRVCPFGPVEPWREVGRVWTDNAFMKKFQEWYPDPPLVVFISNNEHAKLPWTEVETSKRYMDKYGKGKPDEFKRKVVSDGWIERYRAMLESMRAGLTSENWRKHVKFVGYEAFPPVHFGRWSGWKDYSLYTTGRLDPQPLSWDGGSPSYYLHNWMAITDYTLWSPQVETMNWVFMLEEVQRTRPEFWFELSTWDGNTPDQGNDKRKFYIRQGQRFTPARYEGFVQYGMWLTRPRVVREFRSHLETIEYAGPYFEPILAAVDRVYTNPTLQRFWRKGALVVNPRGKHPFQSAIPAEYKDTPRWFLLDTSLTPKEMRAEEFDNAKPPSRQTEVPIFALALVLGSSPEREWLVFAHAPRAAQRDVSITLPDFGPITVDVPQSGSFYHVKENGKQVSAIVKGGPASLRLKAPRFVDVDAPADFAVSDKYSPTGSIGATQWDFGDGKQGGGDRVEHRFAKPGQYLVTATGSEGERAVVHEQVPVFVGIKPEDGLVCRLLMKGAMRDSMPSWIWLSGWDKVEYHFIPDASGAGNLGFLAGGQWVKDEKRGTVLQFDGQRDRVEINNSADLNTDKAYPNRTIAFWFRPDRLTGRQVLYEEGGPGSGLNLYVDGAVLRGGVWSENKGHWLEQKDVTADAWHHVAFVLRGGDKESSIELYLDGAKVGTGKAPLLGVHPGDINIGRAGNTRFHDDKVAGQPANPFAGRLDDFRIANRAWTAEQIRALASLKNIENSR
jgi:hypothetical protein